MNSVRLEPTIRNETTKRNSLFLNAKKKKKKKTKNRKAN